MYLDTDCTYTETVTPHTYVFIGRCKITREWTRVVVRAEELFRLRQGEKIQYALLHNTPAEREFLMTGVSERGWEQLFPQNGQREN